MAPPTQGAGPGQRGVLLSDLDSRGPRLSRCHLSRLLLFAHGSTNFVSSSHSRAVFLFAWKRLFHADKPSGETTSVPLERFQGRRMLRSGRDAKDRSTHIFFGSFLFKQMAVAQMVQSVFSLFCSQRFFEIIKAMQSEFSKEFLFLICKLLCTFLYQIINRYNFSEHLQRGHLQDLAQRAMCYYKELCHFQRNFRLVDQILT